MTLADARSITGIIGGGAVGYIIAVCLLGLATPTGIGVAVAILAAAVLVWFLVKAIETDRRARDKARHPASWCVYDETEADSGI